MKKTIRKKLTLSKETVANLEANDLAKVEGGIWTIDVAVCTTSTCGDQS